MELNMLINISSGSVTTINCGCFVLLKIGKKCYKQLPSPARAQGAVTNTSTWYHAHLPDIKTSNNSARGSNQHKHLVPCVSCWNQTIKPTYLSKCKCWASLTGFYYTYDSPPPLMILIWGLFWSRHLGCLPSSDCYFLPLSSSCRPTDETYRLTS